MPIFLSNLNLLMMNKSMKMKSVASNEIAEYVTPVEASVIYKKKESGYKSLLHKRIFNAYP